MPLDREKLKRDSTRTRAPPRSFGLNTVEHPASSNAFDSLGKAYAGSGQKDLAIQSYQMAVTLDLAICVLFRCRKSCNKPDCLFGSPGLTKGGLNLPSATNGKRTIPAEAQCQDTVKARFGGRAACGYELWCARQFPQEKSGLSTPAQCQLCCCNRRHKDHLWVAPQKTAAIPPGQLSRNSL